MATTPVRDTLSTLKDGASDTAALAAVFEQLNTPQLLSVGAVQLLLAPKGYDVHSVKKYLDEYLPAPARRRGKATLLDLDSFLAFVLRFKGDHSLIYATPDPDEPYLEAVFNANPAGSTYTDAGWGDHRARYAPALSEEWKAWDEQDGIVMTQADFAVFLEDRLADVIVAPDGDETLRSVSALVGGGRWAGPSQLRELSRGMQVNVDMTVKEALVLESGEINVQYTEVHTTERGRPLKVPNLFVIQVPVFFAGVNYRIPAHLRYRVQGGRMTWWYNLVRPEKAFEDAFNEVVARVRDESDLPVFLGTPEA